MCHDGAFPQFVDTDIDIQSHSSFEESASDSDIDGGTSSDGEQLPASSSHEVLEYRLSLRAMIHWFMDRGYNISLINSLDFRDTKASFAEGEPYSCTV
ncbi:hypothetical protein N7468_002862 [Penicillium chermesinum]|uniref:Uncharacterized protein n=1 Tax=Penicillium chermesinum TaxID=63820 RepID=A0A9W9PJC2_9EURO|nr:uncharacterized protein N7468_002862 [Penicillium chermesinum]KAJ5247879.1 hypothetical protein N7468_002862 [Penicillium chermesinum]